jgi:WD40 repeat protein
LADVTISFDAWKEGNVAPSRHRVAVVVSKSRFTLDEISSRLKQTLVHPNKEAVLAGVRFSPDGRRLIAGDNPGGVVQLWDVESGSQLTKIETGQGYRSSGRYFFLSPDWKTIFASRVKRKVTRIEKEGGQWHRWEFESDVRAWDLATGDLRDTFQQDPVRGIRWMALSPDGLTCMLGEELPGEVEGTLPTAGSLLDIKSRQFRQLPGRLSPTAVFSPDSRTIAIDEHGDDSHTAAVKLFDVPTVSVIRSLPMTDNFATFGWAQFSPNSELLVTTHQVLPREGVWKEWTDHLRIWDLKTGSEVWSFDLEEKETGFGSLVFSPDGRTLAATLWHGAKSQLFLFGVSEKRLAHRVTLGEKAITRDPVFSPDGRWLAVVTQVFPEEVANDREPSPEDLPQPRIHFVEVGTGLVGETLVAPQAITASLCFSPDGKTLATGGNGRVHLWDLERPPGAVEAAR